MLQTVSITVYFTKNTSSENCSVPSISFLRGLYFLLKSSPTLLGSLWTARKTMPKLFPYCSSAVLIESAWKNIGVQKQSSAHILANMPKPDLIQLQSRAEVLILKFTGEKFSPLLDLRHPVGEMMFPIAHWTKLIWHIIFFKLFLK